MSNFKHINNLLLSEKRYIENHNSACCLGVVKVISLIFNYLLPHPDDKHELNNLFYVKEY